MTLTEVLVVVVVLVVLAGVLLPAFITDNPRDPRYFRIICVSNLKQVGLAFRIWTEDNNGKYPMEIPIANGGTKELAATGDMVAAFRIMSNILTTPKLLFCPADTNHVLANDFGANFTTRNISYFIGLDADLSRPSTIISGDDNFAIGGVPVKSGLLELSTNAPIAWAAGRHNVGGNVVLADGSAWQVNDQQLVQKLIETGLVTNRLAIP